MMTQDLAIFADRLTMRHERIYPHTIERVWEAVSTTEHLDVWLLPASQVERRLGGSCSFSWGGPVGASMSGTVTIFEPMTAIRYELDGGYIHFALERIDDETTRLTFIQHFLPGAGLGAGGDWPGSDQPAGADTPWRPGFVAGFHAFLDQLGMYLSGDWTRGQAQPVIDYVYAERSGADAWEEFPDSRSSANSPERHAQLIEIYREHICISIPPE
jgi:uncharacterized protein YndB with AHSA1/START domain